MPLTLGPAIDGLDIRALTWLHQFIGRSAMLDAGLYLGLSNHVVKMGPLVFAICWAWFERRPDRAHRRELLVQAVGLAALAPLLGRLLALTLPFRDRPLFRPELHLVYPLEPGLRTWSAFPSDHAMVAFALAASLLRLSPRIGLWAFAHAAGVVCLPRVYFGQHHPSDVIGGALIGVALVVAVAWIPAGPLGQGRVTTLERERPALFYAVGFAILYLVMTMFDDLRAVAVVVFRALHQVSP